MDEKELIEKLHVYFEQLVPKAKIAEALKLSRLREKKRVLVGLFEGHVIRTKIFGNEIWVDVEIGGVILPYRINEIDVGPGNESGG